MTTVPTIVSQFALHGDPDRAVKMAAYMRHQFSFVGVPTVPCKHQSQALRQASRDFTLDELRVAITDLYQRDAREYQYVAIDLAAANGRRLTRADLLWLADFVSQKAWWDSVDAWRKVFGDYLKRHPADKLVIFDRFYGRPDFWERRVAITLQLMESTTLQPALLSKAIRYDRTTDEFFIQKAIGWSLRQYAKTNPDWVLAFIRHYPLSKLATREALKHLDVTP